VLRKLEVEKRQRLVVVLQELVEKGGHGVTGQMRSRRLEDTESQIALL